MPATNESSTSGQMIRTRNLSKRRPSKVNLKRKSPPPENETSSNATTTPTPPSNGDKDTTTLTEASPMNASTDDDDKMNGTSNDDATNDPDESHITEFCIGDDVYIGEYTSNSGYNINAQEQPSQSDEHDNNDYQSFLTPIAVEGEYPEIEELGVPSTTIDGIIHNDDNNKPVAARKPLWMQQQAASEAAAAVDMDDYRDKRQFPKPLHFLWIKKKKRRHATLSEQFADADEQNLVGPQYDPKTLAPSLQLQQQQADAIQQEVNQNPYPSIFDATTSQTAPFQTMLQLPPGTPAATSPPPINAAMAKAQEQYGIVSPALRKKHEQQLRKAKLDLVQAYEKVQALQKNAPKNSSRK